MVGKPIARTEISYFQFIPAFCSASSSKLSADVAPDGAWMDYFLDTINISPFRGSPPQNPLAFAYFYGAFFHTRSLFSRRSSILTIRPLSSLSNTFSPRHTPFL